ncbi:30S ribosomal protein S16 [Polystyrenella longa]|uniref:Small ribosomal subunit protein bS16 n=1 Tax=Polystyrenella longa TaxID=2528007 RepID=A0A518CGM1_9PLAN|nr:30S ribosomal protein S16 [Polystyrenella longa]QDU78375.1 30S ribosomal protein S16 [Polystyrenella longa]
MAVRIRMKKLGRKHRPFYRVCVMDARSPRNGKTIEELGHYDPMVTDKSERVKLNMERIEYWLSVGAQPSDKVGTLIKKVKTNKFGSVKTPPPMQAPKPLPEPEPEAAPEGETAAAEETTEETPAAETAEASEE